MRILLKSRTNKPEDLSQQWPERLTCVYFGINITDRYKEKWKTENPGEVML